MVLEKIIKSDTKTLENGAIYVKIIFSSKVSREELDPLYKKGGIIFNALRDAGYFDNEGKVIKQFTERSVGIFDLENQNYKVEMYFFRKSPSAYDPTSN